jgi:hypothetical protein
MDNVSYGVQIFGGHFVIFHGDGETILKEHYEFEHAVRVDDVA